MTPFEERDDQTAKMIRREIDKVVDNVRNCGWTSQETAWHRAFGEVAGMHRILALIDADANQVLPHKVMPQS